MSNETENVKHWLIQIEKHGTWNIPLYGEEHTLPYKEAVWLLSGFHRAEFLPPLDPHALMCCTRKKKTEPRKHRYSPTKYLSRLSSVFL